MQQEKRDAREESKKKDDSQEPSQALNGVPSRYGNPCVREQPQCELAHHMVNQDIAQQLARRMENQSMVVAYGETTRWIRVGIKYTELLTRCLGLSTNAFNVQRSTLNVRSWPKRRDKYAGHKV